VTHIPFNRPCVVGTEFAHIREAITNAHLSTSGPFGARCGEWLRARTGSAGAYLTHSCTAALEIAAFLLELEPGDEVIMPSYTFVSTANAVAVRGGVPVFVDIRADTCNLDEARIEEAITPRTRAIMPVHYAGVSCEMDAIAAIARAHALFVIEDAAQGVLSTYRGRPLGRLGDAAALSFHETKNVQCGEGGALLINREEWLERADVIRQKGTNRSQFFRGQVDKYTWVDLGSNYGLSDLNAAYLWGQFEHADELTRRRLAHWHEYDDALADLERKGLLRRPIVPSHCEHNAHLYYVLVEDLATRTRALQRMSAAGIVAVFHYVPLHSSPAGRRFGRASGELPVTDSVGERLIRLPLWNDIRSEDIARVTQALWDTLVG
jgi:dTDP-4-amino-4,6-dideoxygalactose transaminase